MWANVTFYTQMTFPEDNYLYSSWCWKGWEVRVRNALCASQSYFLWAPPHFCSLPILSWPYNARDSYPLITYSISAALHIRESEGLVLFCFIWGCSMSPDFHYLGKQKSSLPLLETHGEGACFREILTRHPFLKKELFALHNWGCVKALPNTSFDVKPKALAIFLKSTKIRS